MRATISTIGSPSSLAIEIVGWYSEGQTISAVCVCFWLGGNLVSKGKFSDPVDLHASFVYLSRGTVSADNDQLFHMAGYEIGKLLCEIASSDSLVDNQDYESVMRSSLWFHSSLGNFMLLAIARGADVRLVFVRDGSSTPEFDKILGREFVDAVLVETDSCLGFVADEAIKRVSS